MKLWKVVLGLCLCLALFAAIVQPVQVEVAGAVTIYLDPAASNDTADGLTEATALKTYNKAYDAVKTAGGGTIVFLSTLELTAETSLPTPAARSSAAMWTSTCPT